MKFDDILTKYRKIAFSEHDKGDRFEWLMHAYLLSHPLHSPDYRTRYSSDLKKGSFSKMSKTRTSEEFGPCRDHRCPERFGGHRLVRQLP